MEKLFRQFKDALKSIDTDVRKLARLWHRLSAVPGVRDRVVNECGIQPATLDALTAIAEKRLYPSLAWQKRGLLRIPKMRLVEQRKLFEVGLEVYIQSGNQVKKLGQMTNAEVVQVVTTAGRVRTLAEQKEWCARQARPRKQLPPFEFLKDGVRFNTRTPFPPGMLVSILSAYRKWRPKK